MHRTSHPQCSWQQSARDIEFISCDRDKKQGRAAAGHLMFACTAVTLLLVTLYQVGPLHKPHQLSSAAIFFATGSISSCGMPEQGSAALTSAVGTLNVDCSFRVGPGDSRSWPTRHHKNSHNHPSSQVPQQVQVSGLDALTCAMAKATALSSTAAGGSTPGQQQYVFLLQSTGSGQAELGAAGLSYQVVEYAPLPDTSQNESLAFLLAEWGHLVTAGITQLGCHKPTLGSAAPGEGVTRSDWGLDSFQRRHLLQNTDESPAPSPSPSTPLTTLAPINLTDWEAYAATAPTNSSSNQTAADKPPAPASKANNSANGTTVAANTGKPSSNNTNIASNYTSASNSTTGSNSAGQGAITVQAAAGPADVQQQQALTAILSDKPASNITVNGTSAIDKNAVCSLPPATGPCRASIPRWGYDVKQKSCVEFVWGGCNGNENRFETMQDCLDACAGVVSSAPPGAVNGSSVSGSGAHPNVPAAPSAVPAAPSGAHTTPSTVPAAPHSVPAVPAAVSPTAAAAANATAPPVYIIPTSTLPTQVVDRVPPAPAAQSASTSPLPGFLLQLLSAVGVLVVCHLWL